MLHRLNRLALAGGVACLAAARSPRAARASSPPRWCSETARLSPSTTRSPRRRPSPSAATASSPWAPRRRSRPTSATPPRSSTCRASSPCPASSTATCTSPASDRRSSASTCRRPGRWDDIVQMVADAAAKAKPGAWIVGRGWHQEKWDTAPEPNVDGFPTHDALSKVSPDNPVLLTHASGHATFANAKAMELAGVTRRTKTRRAAQIISDRAATRSASSPRTPRASSGGRTGPTGRR